MKLIREFDALERPAFLEKYGFGESLTYYLRHNGSLYDSKALAGAAYAFQHPDEPRPGPDDFVGGRNSVVSRFEALGFEVVSEGHHPVSWLEPGRVYSWAALGERFGFEPGYLTIAGGMIPVPCTRPFC